MESHAEQLIGELTLSEEVCQIAGDYYKCPGLMYTLT